MTATSEPHCLMTVIFIFNTIMTVRTTHMICVLMVVRGNLNYYYMDQNEFQYIKNLNGSRVSRTYCTETVCHFIFIFNL